MEIDIRCEGAFAIRVMLAQDILAGPRKAGSITEGIDGTEHNAKIRNRILLT